MQEKRPKNLWSQFFFVLLKLNTGTVMSGGFYRYKPAYIKPFPMPSDMVLSKSSLEIENLVKAIEQEKENDTSVLVNQIDFLVYHLYGLTYDEVLIVDPETPIVLYTFLI